MKKQLILSLLLVIGLCLSAFAMQPPRSSTFSPVMKSAPEYRPVHTAGRLYVSTQLYTGLIQGELDPLLGVSYTYTVPYYSFANYVWSIYTAKGDEVDAPITISGNSFTITFQQNKIYDLYCLLYDVSSNEYIGIYSVQVMAGY
jgi:hypothetical protein